MVEAGAVGPVEMVEHQVLVQTQFGLVGRLSLMQSGSQVLRDPLGAFRDGHHIGMDVVRHPVEVTRVETAVHEPPTQDSAFELQPLLQERVAVREA